MIKFFFQAGSSKTDVEGELDVEQEEDDGEPKEKSMYEKGLCPA